MKRAIVLLSNGTEEIEAVTLIDTFRRASWEVVACFIPPSAGAGMEGPPIAQCSRDVGIVCDMEWTEIDSSLFDVMVLPGGKTGTDNFLSFSPLLDAIVDFSEQGRLVCAICAAPLVLERAGLLKGRKATCYPSLKDDLKSASWIDEPVVIDGNVITSQGPGTALKFALTIIAHLEGEDTMKQVAGDMLVF